MERSGLLWSIKAIIRRVGAFELGLVVGVSTGVCRWKAAHGVDALNRCDAAEDAVPFISCDIEQKPGDGSRDWRIDFGGEFGSDLTAIIVLPGWPGKVPANKSSLLIVKKGFRGFEHPAFRTTDVNLKTFSTEGEDELRIRWSGDGIHVGYVISWERIS